MSKIIEAFKKERIHLLRGLTMFVKIFANVGFVIILAYSMPQMIVWFSQFGLDWLGLILAYIISLSGVIALIYWFWHILNLFKEGD